VPPSSAALEVIPRASEKNTPDNKLSAAIGFGILDFNWPGDDSWDIYRGEQLIASHYGHATQALQADTYIIKPKSNPVFNPFDVSIKSGSATKTELGGVLDFNWPGDDSWDICRGEQLVASHYGHATQALQAGTYTIKPKSSAVFNPFDVSIKSGSTTKTELGGVLDFNWPGDDSWDIYRAEHLVASHYGHATQALQAGTYTIKPKSNPVFMPIDIEIKDGRKTIFP
jgi:hypothetical protein